MLAAAQGRARGIIMRIATGLIVAGAVSLLASSAAWSQTAGAKSAAAPQAAPAPIPAPAPPTAKVACANPNALGIGRTVEIDTTGGPGFGFEHFKQLDFLRDHEVVLTFDDGPWPVNTPSVLKTLAEECTTGIFFPIGKHATYHPEILKQVAAAGHTIGAHTCERDPTRVLAALERRRSMATAGEQSPYSYRVSAPPDRDEWHAERS